MNNPENNKWLDKELSKIIGSEKIKPDFEQWKQDHPRAIEALTSRANDTSESKSPLNIRKIIMKNPVAKFATAAGIIIAVFLGGHIFLGEGTAITIADVIEQMKTVVWMHAITEETEYPVDSPAQVIQQYKSESWTSLNPYRYVTISDDGNIIYEGDSDGKYINAQYHPMFNKITIKYFKNRHNNMPSDPLQLFLMQFEELEKHGADVKYKKDNYEGTQVWYIDFKFTPEENIYFEGTLIVDIKTLLPIKLSTNTGDTNNESIIRNKSTVIDYPDKGPTDIYLAGMPEDAKIEKIEDSLPTEFAQAIDEFYAARENIPQKYALVSIFVENNDIIRDVFLVYKNMAMKRLQHYVVRKTGELPQKDADMDSLIKWINGLNPMSHYTRIQDGEYEYAAYPGANDTWSIRKERLGSSMSIVLDGSDNNGDLPDLGWPMIAIDWPMIPLGGDPGYNYKIVQNDYSQKHNLICYERLNHSMIRDGQVYRVASKNLFYVDPKRDYICVRSEYYKQDIIMTRGIMTIDIDGLGIDPESIPTEPCSIIEVTEFGTTSAGQWYPKKIQKSIRTQYSDSAGQSYFQQEEQSVLVYLETDPVFPEGIFDPENLP